MIYGRLLERREEELPDLVPGLWEWAMSFTSPPRPLRRPGRLIVSRPISTAPPFASYSPEQRIIRGFAAAVAKKGYPATTIADIAAAASCGFLASEPAFASLRTVDIYGAGPAAIASRDETGRQIVGALLEPALKAGVNAPDLMIEASAGAIYGSCSRASGKARPPTSPASPPSSPTSPWRPSSVPKRPSRSPPAAAAPADDVDGPKESSA